MKKKLVALSLLLTVLLFSACAEGKDPSPNETLPVSTVPATSASAPEIQTTASPETTPADTTPPETQAPETLPPETTAPAPVTEAPVTTVPAPVTTVPTPVTTAPAPVTTPQTTSQATVPVSPSVQEETFRLTAPSVDGARQIVLDYFKEMATVEWVCRTDMDYTAHKSKLIYKAGETYYGLPYVNRRGFTEKFLVSLDGNKTYTGPIAWDSCIGNTCVASTRVAFDLVSTKVNYDIWTCDTFPWVKKGTVAVGDYSWEGIDVSDTKKVISLEIVDKDRDKIYEAYALTLPCDLLTERHLSTSSSGGYIGHTRMVSALPIVTRGNNGKIVPARSYLITREQTGSFDKDARVNTTWILDKQYSFGDLAKNGYLPMRLEEFETGVIPDAVITAKGLDPLSSLFSKGSASGKIESNYPILIARAALTDSSGKVVASSTICPSPNKVADFTGRRFDVDLASLPEGEYVYTVSAKVGFGEVECFRKTVTR